MKQNLQIQKKFLLKIVTILGVLLLFGIPCLQAQTPDVLDEGAIITSGTYKIPDGITKIKVEAIGGGGGGSYCNITTGGRGGGGGGGGAYAYSGIFEVTPGTEIEIFVGEGGSGNTSVSNAKNGGDSYVVINNDTVLLARGGSGVEDNRVEGATGGEIGSGTEYADGFIGGDGGDGITNGNNSLGGGGGGAAGRTARGNDGNDANTNSLQALGGTGIEPGGSGGKGAGNPNGIYRAENGLVYGGGGGGASSGTNSGERPGGDGASGAVFVTFVCEGVEFAIDSTVSKIKRACQGAQNGVTSLTFYGTPEGLPEGIYTVNYTVAGVGYDTTNIEVKKMAQNSNITLGTIANIRVPTEKAGAVILRIVSFKNETGCSNAIDNDETTITIDPIPQAIISQSAEVCEGTPVTLTFTLEAGTPPWCVTYSDDSGKEETLNGITSPSITTDPVTPPVGSTRYDITCINDAKGCGVCNDCPKK